MALPVVSYGTYNYGDYASPKAVEYKGGLGEGLTTAILGIQKAKQEQKAQIKQALEDSLLLSSEFSSKLNTLFGKASSYNKQFLQNLKVDYGNNVKNYKLGKISFEEFEDNNSYFDNILNDATLLSQIMQPVVTSESDIKFTDARDDDDNQASVLTRWGIKNGKYLLDRDEDGLKVVVAHGTPGSFEAKGISATELINNPAYITPELKYRNEENEAYNRAAASLKELLLLKPDLITATNYSKTGQTLFNIDPAKQAEVMAEIANQDGIDTILGTELQKRTYFEDNMKDKNGNPNGVGSYKGTDEQIAAIKGALSVDLYNTLSKNPIGSKAYTPPGDDLTSAQKIALEKQEDLENNIDQALVNLQNIINPHPKPYLSKYQFDKFKENGITPEQDLTNSYRGLQYSSGTSIKNIKRIEKVHKNTKTELIVDLVVGAGTTGSTDVIKNVNLKDPNVISNILPSAAKRDYPDISKDIITKYNLSDYKGIKF